MTGRSLIAAALIASCDGGGAELADGGPDGDVDAVDAANGACAGAKVTSSISNDPDRELVVAQDPAGAIIADPSIVYPPGLSGALAYSSVPVFQGAAIQDGIVTRVAVSADSGASWTYAATVNSAVAVAPPAGLCPVGSTCTAKIVNETPTILYDAGDPDANRRWKLYTHRYYVLRISGQPQPVLLYTIGHIAQFTAPLRSGPWSAPEVAVGWPGSAFSSTGARYDATDDAATAGCAAFGEPGATVASDGSLHLALSCIRAPFADPVLDIALLRSTDHGASWSFASLPLLGSDGACFGGGGKRVNAVDLFTIGSTEYLMATPEGPNTRLGCVVIPFGDPNQGTLVRSADGTVSASRHLMPAFDTTNAVHYAGACTYGEGASATGYTMSHLVVAQGTAPVLHEIATAVTAP